MKSSRTLGPLEDYVRGDATLGHEVQVRELVLAIVQGLRRMRERAGFTQQQMADKLGVSQGRVSQIESGVRDFEPNLDMLARYAAACDEQVFVRFSGDRTALRKRLYAGGRAGKQAPGKTKILTRGAARSFDLAGKTR